MFPFLNYQFIYALILILYFVLGLDVFSRCSRDKCEFVFSFKPEAWILFWIIILVKRPLSPTCKDRVPINKDCPHIVRVGLAWQYWQRVEERDHTGKRPFKDKAKLKLEQGKSVWFSQICLEEERCLPALVLGMASVSLCKSFLASWEAVKVSFQPMKYGEKIIV